MAYGIMYNGLYFCCLWLTFCVLLFGLADIVTDLEHHLDARWKHFGVHLKVEWSVLESIEKDRVGRTDDCMLELMGKWVFFPNGNRVPASHMADNSGGREENRIWRPRRKHSIQAWSGSDL